MAEAHDDVDVAFDANASAHDVDAERDDDGDDDGPASDPEPVVYVSFGTMVGANDICEYFGCIGCV